MWLWPALLLMIPLLGAAAVIVAPAKHARWIALGASTATLIHSIVLAVGFLALISLLGVLQVKSDAHNVRLRRAHPKTA